MQWLQGHRVVFLPGLDGTGLSFDPLRAFLPPGVEYAVVRYPKDEFLSFEETVECAADQILGLTGFVALAESFSGPIAIRLLSSGQFDAKCLILCATFAEAPRPILLKLGRILPLSTLLALPVPKFALRMFVGGDDFCESLFPLFQRIRAAVPPKMLAHRLGLVAKVDVVDFISDLRMPCCYIQATEDRVVPSSSLAPFRELISNLQIRQVPGPHCILQAQPEACMSIIDEFVGLISGQSN